MRMILILLFTGSAAQAGAWEEFEARCLVPMENVEFPQLDDLERSSRKLERDGLHYEDRFVVKTYGNSTYVLKHNFLSGEAVSCSVEIQVSDNFDTIAPRFEAAMKARRDAKRYYVDSRWPSQTSVSFLSTGWREPKLSVGASLLVLGSGLSFWVEETDLES